MPDDLHRRGNARAELCDAALARLMEAGHGGLTLSALSERTGLTERTIRETFPGPDSLMQEMFSRYGEDYEQGLADALARHPIEDRRTLVEFLVRSTSRTPDSAGLAIAELEFTAYHQRTGQLAGQIEIWQNCLIEPLREVLSKLGIGEARDAARTLVAVCRGSELEVVMRGKEIGSAVLARRLNAVIDGYLAANRPVNSD